MFLDLAEVILGDGMGNLGNDVIESQQRKGLRASGRSAASIRSSVEVAPTQLVGQLWGSVTFTWQQNGRKPNRSGKPSRAMVEQVAEWLTIKGLSYRPGPWPPTSLNTEFRSPINTIRVACYRTH